MLGDGAIELGGDQDHEDPARHRDPVARDEAVPRRHARQPEEPAAGPFLRPHGEHQQDHQHDRRGHDAARRDGLGGRPDRCQPGIERAKDRGDQHDDRDEAKHTPGLVIGDLAQPGLRQGRAHDDAKAQHIEAPVEECTQQGRAEHILDRIAAEPHAAGDSADQPDQQHAGAVDQGQASDRGERSGAEGGGRHGGEAVLGRPGHEMQQALQRQRGCRGQGQQQEHGIATPAAPAVVDRATEIGDARAQGRETALHHAVGLVDEDRDGVRLLGGVGVEPAALLFGGLVGGLRRRSVGFQLLEDRGGDRFHQGVELLLRQRLSGR